MNSLQMFKLDAITQARLKRLGELRNRTPYSLAKTAILEYLDREEAYEREKREDLERWEHYQATSAAILNSEVQAWLHGIANGPSVQPPR